MVKNKCKGCTDRKVGCHSNCESYITYRAECERIIQNRNKDVSYNEYNGICGNKATRIHFGLASR